MSKHLKIVLILLLCILGVSQIIYAAQQAKISVAEVTAAPGETIEVVIKLEENPGIAFLSIPLDYDDRYFESVKINGVGLDGWTIKTSAVWAGAENSNYTGDILILRCKVREDAANGEAKIHIGTVEAWSAFEEAVAVVTVDGKVTIKKQGTDDKNQNQGTEPKPGSSSQSFTKAPSQSSTGSSSQSSTKAPSQSSTKTSSQPATKISSDSTVKASTDTATNAISGTASGTVQELSTESESELAVDSSLESVLDADSNHGSEPASASAQSVEAEPVPDAVAMTDQEASSNQFTVWYVVIVVGLLAACGVGMYFYNKQRNKNKGN